MRSDTAFFSAAVIARRFLSGLASDLRSAAAAADGFLVEEDCGSDIYCSTNSVFGVRPSSRLAA